MQPRLQHGLPTISGKLDTFPLQGQELLVELLSLVGQGVEGLTEANEGTQMSSCMDSQHITGHCTDMYRCTVHTWPAAAGSAAWGASPQIAACLTGSPARAAKRSHSWQTFPLRHDITED